MAANKWVQACCIVYTPSGATSGAHFINLHFRLWISVTSTTNTGGTFTKIQKDEWFHILAIYFSITCTTFFFKTTKIYWQRTQCMRLCPSAQFLILTQLFRPVFPQGFFRSPAWLFQSNFVILWTADIFTGTSYTRSWGCMKGSWCWWLEDMRKIERDVPGNVYKFGRWMLPVGST